MCYNGAQKPERRRFMEFKGLSKVHAGKFIDRYDIVYETADGNEKVYEMISRDHDIDKNSSTGMTSSTRPRTATKRSTR